MLWYIKQASLVWLVVIGQAGSVVRHDEPGTTQTDTATACGISLVNPV